MYHVKMLHLSFLLLQSAVNWLQCKNEHDNVIVTENGRGADAQNKEAKSSPHKGSDFASQNKEDFYDLGRCISKI